MACDYLTQSQFLVMQFVHSPYKVFITAVIEINFRNVHYLKNFFYHPPPKKNKK